MGGGQIMCRLFLGIDFGTGGCKVTGRLRERRSGRGRIGRISDRIPAARLVGAKPLRLVCRDVQCGCRGRRERGGLVESRSRFLRRLDAQRGAARRQYVSGAQDHNVDRPAQRGGVRRAPQNLPGRDFFNRLPDADAHMDAPADDVAEKQRARSPGKRRAACFS